MIERPTDESPEAQRIFDRIIEIRKMMQEEANRHFQAMITLNLMLLDMYKKP